ncbi:asparagine synthase (glutamine-hydrolyzing) [bacterium]|nr:asparagine synthase (glutamine-hydrolyzing) [bacterium]
MKPLYYLHDGEKLIFASEIKAILECPNIDREVNLEALHYYLTYLYVPVPNTMFKGIKRLEPAHILTWTRRGIKFDRYWKLDITEELGKSEEYYAENLLNQLKSTVQMEMVADVPVGIFLSGGIDSSAIVAVAAQLSSEPVKTFSIGFEEEEYNELKYARLVAEKYKTEHYEFIVKPNELDLLTKIIWQFDEPFADSSALANYRLAEMASQYVKVALSGAGGDEVFAGYYHYQADKIAAILDKYPDFIKTFIPKVIDILPISQQKPNVFRRIKRVLENAVYLPEYRHYRYINIYNFNEEQKAALYSHDLKQQLKDSDSFDFTKNFFDEAEAAQFLQRALYVDLFTYLSNDVLVLTDKMSMLHSLEVRVPFLNHTFLEYAFTIPPSLKLKGFEKKYILKKAFKNLLPPIILKRKKRGFGVPILHWFNRELKDVFVELFSEKAVKERGYFNHDYIHRLLKQHTKGVYDNSFKLWQLLCFEIWYRIYIDEESI